MKIRSFIAINLPEEAKNHLLVLLEELKRKNRQPSIKWVNPEGLHITLHFLGYQEEGTLEKIGEIIEKLKLKIENLKLELALGEISAFPNLSRPRVLFVSCLDGLTIEILKRFQKELGKELEKLGLEVDKRPWTPHITLARLKMPILLNLKSQTSNFKNLSFKVKSIDLMKSELMPTGAKYTILKKFSL